MRGLVISAMAGAALAGCSEGPRGVYDSEVAYSVAVEADASAPLEEAAEAMAETSAGGEIPVSAPQIAYTYRLGFQLPLGSIKPVQEQHAEMCESRGPQKCRIISMRQDDSGEEYASGRLEIAVAASDARAFAKQLETTSGDANGELTSSSLTGEDLSKDIVDTEARLRSREMLRDRLMDILARRAGTVSELVEAERGVAQVNQEIDQARSWLETMRGRVAFSEMTIDYSAGARSPVGGFSEPIVTAWNSLGGILGGVIAGIMVMLTALVPIALLIAVLRAVLHRFGYRLRFWKSDLREPEAETEDAPA